MDTRRGVIVIMCRTLERSIPCFGIARERQRSALLWIDIAEIAVFAPEHTSRSSVGPSLRSLLALRGRLMIQKNDGLAVEVEVKTLTEIRVGQKSALSLVACTSVNLAAPCLDRQPHCLPIACSYRAIHGAKTAHSETKLSTANFTRSLGI